MMPSSDHNNRRSTMARSGSSRRAVLSSRTTSTRTSGSLLITYVVPFFMTLALISFYATFSRSIVGTIDIEKAISCAITTDASTTTSPPVQQVLRNSTKPTTTALQVPSRDDWPGIPKEELGHALVKKGVSFVDDSRSMFFEYLEEFLRVYKNRPDKVNMCGIRINHAFALYSATKRLQPSAVIESGVNAGQSTYFIRAAHPTTRIYAIDPLDKPICGQEKRWIDDSGRTEYFTGKKAFKDLDDIDWASKVKSKELVPSKTLVFLDDHLKVFGRLVTLLKVGFRHVLVEDNYKTQEGATAADRAGWTPKQMLKRVDDDTVYFWHNIKSYAEFPPLVAPIMAKASKEPRKPAGGFMHHADKNTDIVAPILRADNNDEDKKVYERVCEELGIDPELKDRDSYMQVMNYNQPCYFELIAMSPHLQQSMLYQQRKKKKGA